MRLCIHALIALMAVALSGCSIRTAEEERAEEAVRQATADLAADIFEAMRAIEAGLPHAMPVTAAKVSAATIIQANGRTHAPAEAFMRGFTATNPSPVPPQVPR